MFANEVFIEINGIKTASFYWERETDPKPVAIWDLFNISSWSSYVAKLLRNFVFSIVDHLLPYWFLIFFQSLWVVHLEMFFISWEIVNLTIPVSFHSKFDYLWIRAFIVTAIVVTDIIVTTDIFTAWLCLYYFFWFLSLLWCFHLFLWWSFGRVIREWYRTFCRRFWLLCLYCRLSWQFW